MTAGRIAPASREEVAATKRKAPSLKTQVAVLKRQAVCFMCREPFTGKQVEFDHLTPIYFGGADDESNLRATCSPCHRRKSAADAAHIAKAKRLRGETGRNKPGAKVKKLKSRGFTGHRKFNGEIVRREGR